MAGSKSVMKPKAAVAEVAAGTRHAHAHLPQVAAGQAALVALAGHFGFPARHDAAGFDIGYAEAVSTIEQANKVASTISKWPKKSQFTHVNTFRFGKASTVTHEVQDMRKTARGKPAACWVDGWSGPSSLMTEVNGTIDLRFIAPGSGGRGFSPNLAPRHASLLSVYYRALGDETMCLCCTRPGGKAWEVFHPFHSDFGALVKLARIMTRPWLTGDGNHWFALRPVFFDPADFGQASLWAEQLAVLVGLDPEILDERVRIAEEAEDADKAALREHYAWTMAHGEAILQARCGWEGMVVKRGSDSSSGRYSRLRAQIWPGELERAITISKGLALPHQRLWLKPFLLSVALDAERAAVCRAGVPPAVCSAGVPPASLWHDCSAIAAAEAILVQRRRATENPFWDLVPYLKFKIAEAETKMNPELVNRGRALAEALRQIDWDVNGQRVRETLKGLATTQGLTTAQVDEGVAFLLSAYQGAKDQDKRERCRRALMDLCQTRDSGKTEQLLELLRSTYIAHYALELQNAEEKAAQKAASAV